MIYLLVIMNNGLVVLTTLIRMPTDATSNHSMLLLVMNYLAAMVRQVGTPSLVVLLVHPYLVELVIV